MAIACVVTAGCQLLFPIDERATPIDGAAGTEAGGDDAEAGDASPPSSDKGVACADVGPCPHGCCLMDIGSYCFPTSGGGAACKEAGGAQMLCDDPRDCITTPTGQWCCSGGTNATCKTAPGGTGNACSTSDLFLCDPALDGGDCFYGGPCKASNAIPGYFTCGGR
jgi:hypothetical protein